MAALGRLPSDHGIAAMNSINVTVINPGFFLAFFGTGLLCLLLWPDVLLVGPGERQARPGGGRDLSRRAVSA